MSEKTRNYGIDLLRIVSMFMVVMLHVLSLGGILEKVVPLTVNYMTASLFEVAAYCAVNCYALISGYGGYKSKHGFYGIVNIVLCVIFYVITLTVFAFFSFDSVGFKDVVKSLLFLRSGGYWYFWAYLGAYFFFPILDIVVEILDKKKSTILIISILSLYTFLPLFLYSDVFSTQYGYSPIWLMMLYYIGAYIRKYKLEENKSVLKYIGIYVGSVLITFLSVVIIGTITNKIFGKMLLEYILLEYTSPTIVICAISLLIIFANLKIGIRLSRIVRMIAPLTFGVYLIHMQYFVMQWLKGRFEDLVDLNPVIFPLAIVGVVFTVYTACIAIDFVRNYLFKALKITVFLKKVDNFLTTKYINDI